MTPPVERVTDVAATRQMRMLAGLLDHDDPPWRPGVVPPLAHWLLFPPLARQSAIGEDGHPRRGGGGVLPDVDLPRRMWAGSRVRFLADIPLDGVVERTTELLGTKPKAGRGGAMLFVTLRHTLHVGGAQAIEEEQDIVYREASPPGTAARPPAPDVAAPIPAIHRTMVADPVQLLRFSALTYNAHRIHYDRDYALRTEGYPGLVVHGPYLATLLMDLYLRRHPGTPVAAFEFRALRPVFDADPFTLGMTATPDGADLAVIDAAGGVAMAASVTG